MVNWILKGYDHPRLGQYVQLAKDLLGERNGDGEENDPHSRICQIYMI